MLDIVDEELDNDIPYGRMLENDERSYR
jgi:hypothetical protein